MANLDSLVIQFKANGTDKAVKNIKDMSKAVKALGDGLNNLSTQKLNSFANAMNTLKSNTPTKGQAQRMKDFASGVRDLSNAISGANIGTFAKNMNNIGQAVSGLKGQSLKGITNTLNAMQQLGQQAQQTGQQMKQALNVQPKTQPVAPTPSQPLVPANFKDAIPVLDKIQVKAEGIKGILQKMGIVTPTKQFKNLESSAEKVRAKYNEVRDAMIKAMQSGGMTQGDSEYKKKMAELDALRNKYDELIQKQRELALEGGAFKINDNITKAYQGIQQAVGGAKQAFSGVASAVQTANRYINSFFSKLTKVGSATRTAKRDTVKFTDSIKRLGKEVTRVSKMLKLMITRMALRKVIEEVGNGFKSLAIHSAEFDSRMSGLINSSKTLGYSVAGMAGQLLNALAPVLMQIIALVTKAVNALNMLFSALRGKGTWAKAKEQTGKWSDAIAGANKNAKELKKTVMGFDELNQLNDNSSSGGGGGSDITDQFEDVDIPDWAKDLAAKIKKIAADLFEPIKKAWEKCGDFVKASWKYAMQQVLALAKDVARDFMTVWKQADTQKIFENILLTIGWIGMAVGNLAKQFREAWNYNQTGLHILENIRDIILIITNHIRNMAEATAMWAASLNFKPLLIAIEGWLQSLEPAIDAIMGILEDFYTQVVLKFTKWVIESGLPELINVFKRFNEEVDWEGLRAKLAKLWEHLEPFMEVVGEGLIIFVERVTTALKDFINGEEFADFLDKLGKWMDTVTPEDVADGIEKLVKALVGFKVVGVVMSVLSAAAGIISAIATACSGLGSIAGGVGSFVSAIGGLGGAILPIVGIATAVVAAIYSLIASYGGLEGAMTKIKDTVKSIVDAIKKKAEEVKFGEKIDKLKEKFDGLKAALGNLKGVWDILFAVLKVVGITLSQTLVPMFSTLIDIFADSIGVVTGLVEIIGGLADILVGLFTGDKDRIVKGAEDLWDGVKTAFSNAFDFIEDLLSGLEDIVTAPFKTIKYLLVGDPIVIDMWDEITKVFDDSIQDIVGFVEDLKEDVVKFFGDIKSKVDEKVNDIKTKLGEWSDKFKETKDNIKTSMENLKSDTTTKMDNIKTHLGTFKDDWVAKWQDAKAKLDDFKTNSATSLTSIKDNVVKCFEGIKNGIKTPINDALGFVEKMVNGIIDAFNGLGEKLGSLDIDIPDWVEEKTGISDFKIGLPKLNKISIPRLAHGGFPEDGLFFANHSELVGNFENGKTAVANNSQIISGIEQGVYNAVSRANANSDGGSKYIVTEISVDKQKLARVVSEGQEKNNRRYSPSMA